MQVKSDLGSKKRESVRSGHYSILPFICQFVVKLKQMAGMGKALVSSDERQLGLFYSSAC